jgi:hypothetical protein
MNDYYVYILFRETCKPFYVGKGKGNRWLIHLREAKNATRRSHCVNIIQNMLNRGFDVPMVKLHQNLTNRQALDYEIALIAAIGRTINGGPLVNKTDGGDGHSNPSPEARAKISAAHRGRKIPREVVERHAAMMRGRKASLETRAKMSAIRLGRGFSPERNKKVSMAKLGKKFTPEARANMSAAKKRSPPAHLKTAFLGKSHSPESKAKIAASLRGRTYSPESIEKMREARRNFWTRRRSSNLLENSAAAPA